MVQAITPTTQQNQAFFSCEVCKFKYKEREWAQKCEDWCKEKGSCNMEITAHAVRDN